MKTVYQIKNVLNDTAVYAGVTSSMRNRAQKHCCKFRFGREELYRHLRKNQEGAWLMIPIVQVDDQEAALFERIVFHMLPKSVNMNKPVLDDSHYVRFLDKKDPAHFLVEQAFVQSNKNPPPKNSIKLNFSKAKIVNHTYNLRPRK